MAIGVRLLAQRLPVPIVVNLCSYVLAWQSVNILLPQRLPVLGTWFYADYLAEKAVGCGVNAVKLIRDHGCST